jgi:hypothetical protein
MNSVNSARPIARVVAFSVALVVFGANAGCAATKSTAAPSKKPSSSKPSKSKSSSKSSSTSTSTVKGSAIDASRPVTVDFDTPGSTPRPLKEVTVTVSSPVTTLDMEITKVSYAGATCGFSFRGTRPPSPVKVRIWGATGSGADAVAFDSGPLAVAWEPAGTRATSADSGSDKAAGWNFLADAVPNRNGPGWVVQAAGVPQKKDKPTTLRCSLTSEAPITSANGPIGYWAGFATI